jgi:thiol-disulfide isomerase/thioredoxin
VLKNKRNFLNCQHRFGLIWQDFCQTQQKMFIMNKCFFLLALIALLASSSYAQIKFETRTLAAALEKAKKENKPVFVDVFAVWCGPCKRMAATAFVDPEVAEFYNKHFINVKVDGEKNDGPGVMSQYGITAYPTLLYFQPDGTLAKQVVGGQDAAQLMKHGAAIAKPEQSLSLPARKTYHASKKSRKDLNKLIGALAETDDDSLDYYAEVYYKAYPKLNLENKAEMEVFMRCENDLNNTQSKVFLDNPSRVSSEAYMQKLNMFIQQSYMNAVGASDFALMEKDIRVIYPYLQKSGAKIPELEAYIEYVRSEFNKVK